MSKRIPSKRNRPGLPWGIVICAVGMCLLFLPDGWNVRLRTAAGDMAYPGQAAVCSGMDWLRDTLHQFSSSRSAEDRVAALQKQLDQSELKYRQLALQQRIVRERNSSREDPDDVALKSSSSEPLLIPALVETRVIGSGTAALWQGKKSLAAGTRQGMQESLLVLDGPRILIDQGSATQLAPNDMVYAGRTVVGRISAAGYWSSTLQLVTDARFRGPARIFRESKQGWIPGPEGNLEGDGGELCNMTLVESTEPVEPGDAVYTAGEDGVLPFPMYYGRVVETELKPGALEWSIRVRPALHDVQVRNVSVLRTKLNPARLLAN